MVGPIGTGLVGVVGGVKPVERKARSGKAVKSAARRVNDITSIMDIPEDELTPKVRAAIMSLMEEVERLRKELKRNQSRVERLEQLADQDSLAPIANRRAFVREMSRIMAFSQRYGTASSVLYFDVDGLKIVNDTHGHAAGDAMLLFIATVLVENIRESDIVGRLGGDEFGVLLAQADKQGANEKAASLAAAVADKEFIWQGTRLPISLSYGAYSFKPGEDVGTALANADKAMYDNKRMSKAAPAPAS
ncbi:MAG: GGDEF domain-containing protein [Proteobacteria bacterium]|nr:GGDEF domain-containing protein [Pseudomonadota bacterium]